MDSSDNQTDPNDIAVVGMACRLPGARSVDAYWELLREGKEALTSLSDEELLAAGVSEAELADPNYVKKGMFLEDMECFDASFFGFGPLDARVMDPQHRHFLECAWEAFEDAGYVPNEIEQTVGVYAGSGHNAYLPYNILSNPKLLEDVGFFLLRHTGNDKDFLSTRASYLFNWRGPSLNIQTACSTSLVAIHTAAQSLLNGECEIALAGGVTIEMPHRQGYLFKESEILSPDGHCRPFEAASGGTLFGSGVGCVVLKRLEDALADGDQIHAVIKSSAINNDGAGKVSYLAPAVEGQANAASDALEVGDIDPKTVEFIECHGTGTAMGDPIEVAALTQAYGENNPKRQYCALGSVKSNIGHTDTAAGVAGFIKTILCLKNRTLVPTLHYQTPNPQIDFENSPFFVNDRVRDWRTTGVRRAAVSSLGVGGTNAHVILQEAPELAGETDSAVESTDPQVLCISARTSTALEQYSNCYQDFLRTDTNSLSRVASNAVHTRANLEHRRVCVGSTRSDLDESLADTNHMLTASHVAAEDTKLCFLFAGGGAQYPNMGKGLYENEPVYKEALEKCFSLGEQILDYDLRSVLFPADDNVDAAAQELQNPSRALPALFATQYAQAKLWESWGILPHAMIGHSMGEYTAATIAGVFDLKAAFSIVAKRGELFETLDAGGMLSVLLTREDLEPYLSGDLSIAAENAKELQVAAGPVDQIEALQKLLEEKEILCRRVPIAVAAHSAMLEPILEPFEEFLRQITYNAPTLAIASNLTGKWITDEEAMDPKYWVRHLRETVRFAQGLSLLIEGESDATPVLLEIGPGNTMSSLAKQHSAYRTEIMTSQSMRHPKEEVDDLSFMRLAQGQLWCAGINQALHSLYPQVDSRIGLPTYPFERKIHWIKPLAKTLSTQEEDIQAPLKKLANQDDWYAYLQWAQGTAAKQSEIKPENWLVFADHCGLADKLLESLGSSRVSNVVRVKAAKKFAKKSNTLFEVNPKSSSDFDQLSKVLDDSGTTARVLYCWSYDNEKHSSDLHARYASHEARSFWGLFNLAKMLAGAENDISVHVVANNVFTLFGDDQRAEKSLALGPVGIMPHEYAHVKSQLIDIEQGKSDNTQILSQLSKEICSNCDDRFVALRGSNRWVRGISAQSLEGFSQAGLQTAARKNNKWLAEAASVLISGGLGGIGLKIAKDLAAKGAKHLILTGRSQFPARDSWRALVDDKTSSAKLRQQLAAIFEIEKSGATVYPLSVDISDFSAMQSSISALKKQLGKINGVIHAAGTLDDELALMKSDESALNVISAKVQGAIVLDKLFAKDGLDFFVLFSSVSSYLGLPGQIDYAAANAYLDAFAHERSTRAPGITKVINWNAWADVGMAAELTKGDQLIVEDTDWPIFSVEKTADSSIFQANVSREQHWLLSEHVTVNGDALLSGTTYIELIRGAFCAHIAADRDAIELEQVQFLVPYQVEPNTPARLQISVRGDESRAEITVYQENDELPNATAVARIAKNALVEVQDTNAIKQRCTQKVETRDGWMDQHFMDFGPRWACIQNIARSDSEALLEITLATEFQEDLESCEVHPALLDMATGASQFLMKAFSKTKDFYVPVAYNNVRILASMPPKFYSHVVLKEQLDDGSVSFGVQMLDLEDRPFMTIESFDMKKVDAEFLNETAHVPVDNGKGNEQMEAVLREAILSDEGVAAFNTVMDQDTNVVQWIVSSVDSKRWMAQLDASFNVESDDAASLPEEPTHDADADARIPQFEALLEENPAVEDVVVRSFIDELDRPRLIAYYVPDWDHQITMSEMRDYAKSVLPDGVVLAQIVELDELARTDDGEIDRKQLSDPLAPEDTYVAPQNSAQVALAKIWADALGISKVSLTDNFFDIGGHSLLGIRVAVKVQKKFGVRLEAPDLGMKTLEQVAAMLGSADETEPADDAVEVDTSDNTSTKLQDNIQPAIVGESKNIGGRLKSIFSRGKE